MRPSRVAPIRRGGLFMSAPLATRPVPAGRQPFPSGAYIQSNVCAARGWRIRPDGFCRDVCAPRYVNAIIAFCPCPISKRHSRPRPVARVLDQASFHGIAVRVIQFPISLLRAPDLHVVASADLFCRSAAFRARQPVSPPSNPSPGPLPDEVHRDSGPPSPPGRGCPTEEGG